MRLMEVDLKINLKNKGKMFIIVLIILIVVIIIGILSDKNKVNNKSLSQSSINYIAITEGNKVNTSE
jgi:Tfp pilus assembly protein PilX